MIGIPMKFARTRAAIKRTLRNALPISVSGACIKVREKHERQGWIDERFKRTGPREGEPKCRARNDCEKVNRDLARFEGAFDRFHAVSYYGICCLMAASMSRPI